MITINCPSAITCYIACACMLAFGLLLWRALVSGYLFGIYHLLIALPGIFFDVFHHVWLSIVDLFPKRKKRDREVDIELDEYERMLS